METYYFLLPLSLIMGAAALWAFFWTLRTRQYEDLQGASERILFDSDDESSNTGEDEIPSENSEVKTDSEIKESSDSDSLN